jgi:hypothetical protein
MMVHDCVEFCNNGDHMMAVGINYDDDHMTALIAGMYVWLRISDQDEPHCEYVLYFMVVIL